MLKKTNKHYHNVLLRAEYTDAAIERANIRRSMNWFDHQLLVKTIFKDPRFGPLFDATKLASLRHSVRARRCPVHLRTRKAVCVESGRTRGFNRFTGLSRFRLKEFMERGLLPGMYRASW